MTVVVDAIEQIATHTDELREEELESVVATITGLEGEALRRAARATDDVIVAGLGEEELHARPGGWIVGLSDAAARGTLAAAVTAGVLAAAGFDQLPALVLPAVLPMLVDIERVELSASEDHLLASLRLQPELTEAVHSPEAVYDRLPEDLRDQVSLLDFLDFVERLVAAGEADERPGGVVLRDADDPAWVRIRLN